MEVSPADFELITRKVKTTSGKEVTVAEMTLRQRDRFSAALQVLASDQDILAAARPFLDLGNAAKDGEPAPDVEIDLIAIVRSVASQVGDGALTRLLAIAVLEAPENRELFPAGEKPEEWALDNLRMRDETNLLQAWKECNDLGKYLGNLMGLLSLGARVKKAADAVAE